ncbi:nuclear transport factor 2 family protein [Rhizobium sp. RCAM05350]|nr:nuclear transport factor 2 family protein [Rhizobium sp. RCAM05350]
MSAEVLETLEAAERAFNAAMISNDPGRIAACITPDWVLVTPQRGPVPAQDVLAAIESGLLSHDTMTKTTHHIHLLGDVATVTGRGQNTGLFHGEPISADEWITDVYRRDGSSWRCVLTHLTPAATP